MAMADNPTAPYGCRGPGRNHPQQQQGRLDPLLVEHERDEQDDAEGEDAESERGHPATRGGVGPGHQAEQSGRGEQGARDVEVGTLPLGRVVEQDAGADDGDGDCDCGGHGIHEQAVPPVQVHREHSAEDQLDGAVTAGDRPEHPNAALRAVLGQLGEAARQCWAR